MIEFQNKASSIKELEERISNDSGDNLGIIGILFEAQLDEASEHKNNGKDNEALQCYEEAFELLENEIKKWHKQETLIILGQLYDKLALESESIGNKLMAQDCLRKSLKIKESIMSESDHGEWYYYFDMKWQKVKID